MRELGLITAGLTYLVLNVGVFSPAYAGPLHDAARRADIKKVNQLIAQGANVNEMSKEGFPPIIYAVISGNTAVTEQIIAAGADVNVLVGHEPSSSGTPLHFASGFGKVAMVELLIAKGAEINRQQLVGWTPLFSASSKGHTATAEALIRSGAEVNKKDNDGNTPLHVAVTMLRTKTVKLLLREGADMNVKNRDGMTPLSIAMRSDKYIAKMLKENGAKE